MSRDIVPARFAGFFASPLRYPGGKGRLGPWLATVVEANGLKEGWYIEPYAGGAGAALYLLLQKHVEHIVINDADPLIHSFWWSVVNESAAFEAMIRETSVTMESRARFCAIVANPDQYSTLELGFAAFFLNRTSRSGILTGGVIGGKEQKGIYKLDARYIHEDLIARVRAIGGLRNPLTRLIGDVDQSFVGYVYNLRYDECFVQTNDAFKHGVNGLPHNSFLLAAGFDPARFDAAPRIDQEVVLLRVLGPAPLPQDGDMVRTRIEHHQRRRETERLPGDVNDGLDPMTASELQWGGMRCRVLGTFFMEDGQLRLGSDIENFMSLSRMRAFKPRGASLELIVNHVNPEVRAKARDEAIKAGFKDTPKPIDMGTVRYTSTARLHRGTGEPLVKVQIQPADFLARRTAVLGMTRTGKSNTVKTTVSAVALAAMKSDIRVGQLIFDVNGEYANANHQDDGSSIADVFPNTVR